MVNAKQRWEAAKRSQIMSLDDIRVTVTELVVKDGSGGPLAGVHAQVDPMPPSSTGKYRHGTLGARIEAKKRAIGVLTILGPDWVVTRTLTEETFPQALALAARVNQIAASVKV